MKTLEIDIDPRIIEYNRLNRFLFGDPIKQKIGDELLKAAREKGEWTPVDFNVALGKEATKHYMGAVDSMRKEGYVAYSIRKDDFTVEPTQKLVRYYRLVDYLNKKKNPLT